MSAQSQGREVATFEGIHFSITDKKSGPISIHIGTEKQSVHV